MPTTAQVYRCLLISPSDVQEERDAVEQAIATYSGTVGMRSGIVVSPLRWERHAIPELGPTPQAAINKQFLEHCDMGIAIFWSRLGTATEEYDSGSLEEIARLCDRGARVMVYVCTRDIKQSALKGDQYERLQAALKDLRSRGLVENFDTAEQLAGKVYTHIASWILENQSKRAVEEAKAGTAPIDARQRYATELGTWQEYVESFTGPRDIIGMRNGVELLVFPKNPRVLSRSEVRKKMALLSQRPKGFLTDKLGEIPAGVLGQSETPDFEERWLACTTGPFFRVHTLRVREARREDMPPGVYLNWLASFVVQSFFLASEWSEGECDMDLILRGCRDTPLYVRDDPFPSLYRSLANELPVKSAITGGAWHEAAHSALSELLDLFNVPRYRYDLAAAIEQARREKLGG